MTYGFKSAVSFMLFLLYHLQNVTASSSSTTECCYIDHCNRERICANIGERLTDSCPRNYSVTENCVLLRRCCYPDNCTRERWACANIGETLTDSCRGKYSVQENCLLLRKCCYPDECNGGANICADIGETLRDSCQKSFKVQQDCSLSELFGTTGVLPEPSVGAGGASQDEVPNVDKDNEDGTEEEPPQLEESACIASRLLSHMPASKLVFKKHIFTRVLCDRNESCATKGHMVIYQGSAMRMSSYCKLVSCREDGIHVNSPKYERGLRIETSTEGLEITALAARFDTRAEEILLAGAVRFGL